MSGLFSKLAIKALPAALTAGAAYGIYKDSQNKSPSEVQDNIDTFHIADGHANLAEKTLKKIFPPKDDETKQQWQDRLADAAGAVTGVYSDRTVDNATTFASASKLTEPVNPDMMWKSYLQDAEKAEEGKRNKASSPEAIEESKKGEISK